MTTSGLDIQGGEAQEEPWPWGLQIGEVEWGGVPNKVQGSNADKE